MDQKKIDRFDQLFVIKTIRDFFIVLIAIFEFGIRFLLVIYDFEFKEKILTETAARELASDLKSIMLNSDGPVAARTVFPIFKKNRKDIGYEIAIIPSEVTKISISKAYGFDPKGIPPDWPKGRNHEFTTALTAENICTTCHVDAKVGEVLGYATVRSYLSTKIWQWWENVRLTFLILMGNIIIDTVILFLLLKVRMEPLLSLKSAISSLSKGNINLSYRAEVISNDEFGGLAMDLNFFLDQITFIIKDLTKILEEILNVTDTLEDVNTEMGIKLTQKYRDTHSAIKQVINKNNKLSNFTEINNHLNSLRSVIYELKRNNRFENQLDTKTEQILSEINNTNTLIESIFSDYNKLARLLVNISSDIYEINKFKEEISIIEEKMQKVTETGKFLLGRLTLGDHAKE